MSQMFYDYFKSCYANGSVTQAQLDTAVTKGYLTQDEENSITGNSTASTDTATTTTTTTTTTPTA